MKITWIGHACFRVETQGYSLILDPYEDGAVPGCSNVRETANAVLCSHEHGDHGAVDKVTVVPTKAEALSVTKIETYHDEVKGAKRGPNTIHILSDGKTRVAHLGDLGCDLEPAQKELLRGVDVLLIPVGGTFTIDAAAAAALIRELEPKTAAPMHYRDADMGYPVLGTIGDFTALMDSVLYADGCTLESEKIDAPVVVLKPKNRI